MKKLFLFSALFTALWSTAFAGAPFTAYSGGKTAKQPHTFSQTALVFNIAGGTDLNTLWLKESGEHETLEGAAALPSDRVYTGNFALDFVLSYGTVEARYFGVGGAGCVYFSATDNIKAGAFPWTAYNIIGHDLRDYCMMQFLNLREIGTFNVQYYGNAAVEAGSATSIRIEQLNDTLWIEYNNLIIKDRPETHTLTVSFQYAFAKNGNFMFIPLSMQGPANPDYTTFDNCFYFALGLFHSTWENSIFFSGYNGKETRNIIEISITANNYPQSGTAYLLSTPPACTAVANPSVSRWSYSMGSKNMKINERGPRMNWGDGDRILLILSEKETLEAGDLPVDGIQYEAGSSIGDSKGVLDGYKLDVSASYTSEFRTSAISSLTPYTEYYLHAFPYNSACTDGPVYNRQTVPSVKVKTHPAAPLFLRLDESTLAKHSFTLNVDNGEVYLLAYSPVQLPDDFRIELTGTYQKGDKITYRDYNGDIYTLTVIEPNGTEQAVEITGAEPGSDFYCYAWTKKDDGAMYSIEYVYCSVSTVHEVPCVLDFSSAAASADNSYAPAGWYYEESGYYQPFTVNTRTNPRCLNIQMGAVSEVGEGGEKFFRSRSAAVTPVVEGGGYNDIIALFELTFFSEAMQEISASKPQKGDTLQIEYKLVGETDWNPLGVIDESTEVDPDGSCLYETPVFSPGGEFQLRITVMSSNQPMSQVSGVPQINFWNISFEPALPCKPVRRLQADSLTHNTAFLVWKDLNEVMPLGFRFQYKKEGEEQWRQDMLLKQTSYIIPGLGKATEYEVQVQTVCKDGDSSLVKVLHFTTDAEVPCNPVSSVKQTNLGKTSVDISWTGNGAEYAVCYKETGGAKYDTVYTFETACSLDNLKPGTSYQYKVWSWCEENRVRPTQPCAERYFNTLQECSAPAVNVKSVDTAGAEIEFQSNSYVFWVNYYAKEHEAEFGKYRLVESETLTLSGLDSTGFKIFAVRAAAVCSEGDTSDWSVPVEFTLARPGAGTEPEWAAAIRVGCNRNEIWVINPQGIDIRSIEVFDMSGRRLTAGRPVSSGSRTVWAHNASRGAVLVRLGADGGNGIRTAVYKVSVP